jgi:peptidyl-prolyl cis-trans isomerase-like 4
VQTGDPTNTGRGGDSLYGVLYGKQARFFEDEIRPELRHKRKGILGMAGTGENQNASQFYITTGDNLHSLDDKRTVFGELAEGWDVLDAINEAPCDADGRPLQNIRIRHTIVLDDPLPDPPTLESHIPEASPEPQFAADGRLEDDWVPEDDGRDPEEIERTKREREAQQRAVVLEMIGDLPEADAAPPSNMLFICKLNQVTSEEDLEIIFSRFGRVASCDIIRDWKTGDSLCYGFIGFDSERACEEAYFKMNNVLIDDRRIKVDFSQSVSHLWKQFKKFGGKGDGALAAAAAGHERGHGEAGRGRLQLKEHLRPDGGFGRGGDGYDLVLEGAGGRGGEGAGPQRSQGSGARRAEEERHDGDGDRRGEARGRSREKDKEGRKDKDPDRRAQRRSRSRSKDRSRERRHKREEERRRHRSRSRGGRRSRSRSRGRRRGRD